MAQARTDAVVDSWKTGANLDLTAEQEQQLKAWFAGAVERFSARREAGKQVIVGLQAAVEGNDGAKAEELLTKLREGFRQLSQGREKTLDDFDAILKPEQRARMLLFAVQKAKEAGRPVEQMIDSIFLDAAGN